MHSRFLLAIWLISLSACTTPGEPTAQQLPLSPDYFPPLAVGDTLLWDYVYYDRNAGMLEDMLQGTMRWRVASIRDSAGIRLTSVRQEFNGLLTKHRSDTPYIRDSIWIPSDTTQAAVSEDANHSVTVTTAAAGHYAKYGGWAVIFPRFPANAVQDTLQVATSEGGGGYGTTVKTKKGFGLVYLYYWAGPGMTQSRTWMTRR